MHEDTGTAADSIESTATKASAQTDYGIGLSAATPTAPPVDPRTDAEVIADMRQSSAFPTLLDAFPTTPEGPRRPTSPGERRAAKRAFKHDLKEARRKAKDAGREHRQATKAEQQRYKSISRQLKERDRELSQGSERQRRRDGRPSRSTVPSGSTACSPTAPARWSRGYGRRPSRSPT